MTPKGGRRIFVRIYCFGCFVPVIFVSAISVPIIIVSVIFAAVTFASAIFVPVITADIMRQKYRWRIFGGDLGGDLGGYPAKTGVP